MATGSLTCVALAFLTASFTRTPEAAQLTTFPGFLALVAGLVWVNLTPVPDVHPLMLAMPGAGVAHLSRLGWAEELPSGTGAFEAAAPALVSSVLVAALACAVAAKLFRWEPRS